MPASVVGGRGGACETFQPAILCCVIKCIQKYCCNNAWPCIDDPVQTCPDTTSTILNPVCVRVGRRSQRRRKKSK